MVEPETKGKMKNRRPRPKPTVPAELLTDERFKDVATDPKFRSIPRSEAKVKIDQRFGKMFTDKRFKIKATMDKRGRPLNTTSTEDLKRFYHLDEEEEKGSDSDNDDDEEDVELKKQTEKSTTKMKSIDAKVDNVDDHDEEGDDDGDEEGDSDSAESSAEDELLDFARGEGNLETSEEDSSDSSEDEEEKLMREEAEQEIEWDELDKDAPRNENTSRRLALCNMDWQNLKADDLFVVLNSFVPANGVLNCVRIFPSDFGKKRMEIEARRGPKIDSKNSQALRKYEFDRLRYYYAVVECDNKKTANAIYESCDGMEFQTSGTKLDLRFIPDDMDFDDSEQTDYCDSLPANYEPVDFVNTALMQSTCESTFDSEDLRRKKTLGSLYSKKSRKVEKKNGRNQESDPLDAMTEHLKTYIATSDSDSEAENDSKAAADKYRRLLLGTDRQDEDSGSEDGNKEITFNPALNAAVEKARNEKDDREKSKKTPFQEYLEKKKQKKRERRLAERAKRKKETTFSDDELPAGVDAQDEFFKQSLSDSDSDSETKPEDESEHADDDDDLRKKRQEQELELLLMDEKGDSRKHFSLKKILKNEKQSKKNKNGQVSKAVAQDEFKVNVNDPRFGAIYSDHRFNIDPTDASFKRTKAMDAVLAEKTKRRKVK